MIKALIKKPIDIVGNIIGYDINFIPKIKMPQDNKVRINLGAGNWGCKGWINLDYPSEHYSKAQNKHAFIPYDIRNDPLPFTDNSVDMIYCSHVVEHIENNYVIKMMEECYRTIKEGGVLRLVCPDAEFLYDITKCGKEYWQWMRYWFDDRRLDFNKIRPIDCLIAEISTPKLNGYGWLNYQEDYEKEFLQMDMDEFFAL